MQKIFAAAIIAVIAFSALSARAQLLPGALSSMGWALANSVSEGNGKLAGAWGLSLVSPCMPGGKPPTVTVMDTSLVARLTVSGACNGQTEYFMVRRAQPLVIAAGACGFDYVTVGGMIPGVFQEVAEKTAPAGSFASFRQALPNLQHVFATKQAGGVLALTGWSERPDAAGEAAAEKDLVAAMDRLRSAGQANYKVETDAPWAMFDVRDSQEDGKSRRDVGMNLVDAKACLFSIKLTRTRDPGDDNVWTQFDQEFQRMRRVIDNYENGRPWVLSGAK